MLGVYAFVWVLTRVDLRTPGVSTGCATGAGAGASGTAGTSTCSTVSTIDGWFPFYWSWIGCGNVEIINLNNLWGRILLPSHIHSWELDIIDVHWVHSWDLSIVVFFKIHSWDFNISDEMSVSIGKNQLLRLIASQCIHTSDHHVRHGNDIPTSPNNFLSGIQSHELESTL